MSRQDICRRVEEVGLVPVVRAASAEDALRAAAALAEGGIHVVEITMTVPGALEVVRKIAANLGRDVVVGAGTVLDAETARLCIEVGAEFIVSPGFDRDTILAAHAHEKPAFPGALTPTEVIAAWRAGADAVKIFPCSAVGGAKYLRALRAPLPEVKLLPTGGVNLSTVREFIEAGAVALGVGAELVDAAALAAREDRVITERARQFLLAVRMARSELVRASTA